MLRASQAAPEAECGERCRRRFGEDVWALRHSSVYLGREKSTMGAGQEENGLETLLDLPGAGQEGSSCPNGPGPRVGLTRKPSSGGPDLGAARKGKSYSYLGCSYRQGGVVLRGREDHPDQSRPPSPARLEEPLPRSLKHVEGGWAAHWLF